MNQTRFDRIELKGILDDAGRRSLTAALRARMDLDPHGDADGCYPIVSLYYDTPERGVYWDRVRGVASRRKLRVRLYGGLGAPVPPICFVEIKQKYYGRVAKRRLVIAPEDALALCAGGPVPPRLSPADRLVAEEVRALVARDALRPTCLVRYVRQAFIGRADSPDLRVTLDSHVRCTSTELDPRQVDETVGSAPLDDQRALVEIKVDHAVPRWLVDATRVARMSTRPLSKYALACEALGLVNFPARSAAANEGQPTANRPAAIAVCAAAEKDMAWTR